MKPNLSSFERAKSRFWIDKDSMEITNDYRDYERLQIEVGVLPSRCRRLPIPYSDLWDTNAS